MKRMIAAAAGASLVLVLGSGTPAYAQLGDSAESTANVSSEERVHLRVGEIFEIIADAGADGSTVSWILTQDRTFIEASRDKVFRYRFVQSKRYTLRAEVALPDGVRRQRTFQLDVGGSDAPVAVPTPAGTGASLAGVYPPADPNGRVVLTPDQRLLQLTPVRTDISPLALDVDASRDTDGDGNPGNDVDDTDTYFHLLGRTLWVWIARPVTQTEMIVTGIPSDGSPLVQRITFMSEETASSQGVLTSPITIAVEQIDDGTFGFTPEIVRPPEGNPPLLHEWEFGDGQKSLETNPVHTYATGGPKTVNLHVRDLQTGNTIGKTQTTVSPSLPELPIEEPIDEPIEEPIDEPVDEPEPESSIPWGRVFMVGGIFVLSLAVGIAVVWLLSFLRRSRKLEETLESMEKAVVTPKDQTPPPLAIKAKPQTPPPAAQQKVIDAEVSAAAPSKAPSPQITEAAAPDWLKKGLHQQPSPAQPAPAPAAPAAKPAQPAPTPKPAPKPAPSPAPTAPKPTPAPQQAKPAPTPKEPTPRPQAPTPAQKPATPPAPAPQQPKPTPAPNAPAPTPTQPTPRPAAPSSASKIPAPAAAPKPAPSSSTPPAPAPKPATAPAPQPVTPPTPKPAPAPAPAAPKPAPTAAPAPVAPSTTAPQPAPAPSAPQPTTPPPAQQPAAPAQAKPAPSGTPAFVAEDTSKVPYWLQPSAPTTTSPAPAPAAPPTTTPQPATPPPAQQPAASQPSGTVAPAPTPPKDDDTTIAIIRAESIDPGPQK